MRIHLTGRITIEDGELVLDEAELPKRQGRVLFARLVLERRPIHRDVLADTLWPAEPPATWERTLSIVMSRLRSALARFDGVTISNVSGSYHLEFTEEPEVDVVVAAAQCDAAERALAVGDAARAASSAAVATAIARRSFLAGNSGQWVDAKRSELRAMLVRALEVGAEATLGTSESVALAGEAAELEPFRERTCFLSMRAHHALGNTADALRTYEQHRALLADELGADPGPDVQTLHLELLGSQSDSRIEELSRQGLVGLPTTHTIFIGRTDILNEIDQLLGSQRLITLTGAGGVGKTRLAIEAARRAVAAFPDGVWFVDLAPTSGAASIVEYVALAVGVKSTTAEALATILDGQKALVILDNCEQVIGSVADTTRTLLSSTAGPVILATSRSRLGVQGERVLRVPSMHVPAEREPPATVESVVLFCDRAAAVHPDFDLSSANAAAVVSICRRLDGVPLAIELAAARTSAMSPKEIAEHLQDRFALLRGPAAALPRHRTLRTAIDWSYDLLGAAEAHAFRQLSVFEGSFTLDDAAAICDRAISGVVASLVESSLIVEDEGRFRMLETVKEYAQERAGRTDQWNHATERHTQRFIALLPQLLSDKDQAGFLTAVDHVQADASVALDRTLAHGRVRDAIGLAAAMAKYWLPRGLWADGARRLESTLAAARAAGLATEAVPVIAQLAIFVMNQSELDRAEELYREALASATPRDDAARADALVGLASVAMMRGHADDIGRYARRALELANVSQHDFAAGRALLLLGWVVGLDEEPSKAAVYAEALARFTSAGSQTGIARALGALASIPERTAAARPDWEEPLLRARDVSRSIADRVSESLALLSYGEALATSGYPGEGLLALQEALRLSRRIGDRRNALTCIEQIGFLEAESGSAALAVTLLAASKNLQDELSLASSYADVSRFEALRDRAFLEAGDAADALRDAGGKLSFEETYQLAMSLEPPS